jgi:type I restriction enzyme S subunit
MAKSTLNLKSLHLPKQIRELPREWCWSRLDDVCVGIYDCPHSTPRLVDEGPLIARSQDIITGVFRSEQAAHVSEETYRERTLKAVPSHGDVLYSREGTYCGGSP